MFESILNALKTHGSLSVQELALHLKIDASALHPMLDMLVRKGRIEKVELPCKSGCATGCAKADSMAYFKAIERTV